MIYKIIIIIIYKIITIIIIIIIIYNLIFLINTYNNYLVFNKNYIIINNKCELNNIKLVPSVFLKTWAHMCSIGKSHR